MAEGARLESVFRGNSNVGSNPTLSAILHFGFASYSRLTELSTVNNVLQRTKAELIFIPRPMYLSAISRWRKRTLPRGRASPFPLSVSAFSLLLKLPRVGAESARLRRVMDRLQRWRGLALPAGCTSQNPESGAAFLPCARAFAK